MHYLWLQLVADEHLARYNDDQAERQLMPVVGYYSGHFVDNDQAIREAVESRLLTLVADLRPYSFEFNDDDSYRLIEAKIRAALKPDEDWYTVTSIDITPGLIIINIKSLREA